MKKINSNKSQKEIPVFFSTDDNYVPYLVVSIQSLKDTASIKNKYMLYVLNSGLTNENKKNIKELETSNIKIKFVDVSHKIKNIYSKLKEQLRDYYSPSIYYRLFIPSMFPQYKKALYLDCDIAIVEDIANLYNHELGDNLLGAVVDQVVTNSEIFCYYVENAVGIDRKKYFNSGILVMNLQGLRKENLEHKFLYLLNNFPFSSVAPDQDYLNFICKDRVLYLDKGWDMMPMAEEGFEEKDLKLVHYNMYQKPWKYDGILYQEYFWNSARKTKYYDTLMNMRDSYSEENKNQDIEKGKYLLKYAKEIADDPNNFRRSFEKEYKEKNEHANEAEHVVLDKFWNIIFGSNEDEEIPVNA